jgi:ketosteroid isomerase-like protein
MMFNLRKLPLALLLLSTLGFAGDSISNSEREQLLRTREEVWTSWFANDQQRLGALLPADTIAINNGEEAWQGRDAILKSAQDFKANGGKLISLRFPKTEIQRYGNVLVFYSLFEMTTELKGERTTTNGRATEIFVRKNGRWLNSGWHLDSGK